MPGILDKAATSLVEKAMGDIKEIVLGLITPLTQTKWGTKFLVAIGLGGGVADDRGRFPREAVRTSHELHRCFRVVVNISRGDILAAPLLRPPKDADSAVDRFAPLTRAKPFKNGSRIRCITRFAELPGKLNAKAIQHEAIIHL